MSTTTFARDNFWAAAKTATDSWTHSKNLPAWEHSYEQLKPGAFSGTFTFACLGPLQLVHEKVGGPGVYRGRSWKGSRIFFSVEGSGLRYNNRLVSEHRLGSHRWDGLDLVTSRESVSMTLMAIDEQWLCGRLAETPEAQVLFRGNGRPALLQSDPELVRTFEREVQGMLRELIAQPTILECPVSRASLQGDAIELLIRMLAGRGASGATMPAPSTRAYVVDRALQYVDSKLADPVSIPDICQAVRVCPRTLCYSFESVLGVSPSRYLLASRLNRVRNALRSSQSDISIQQIAGRWGFWHLGRFAKYYRETFGERPSETARAISRGRRAAA